MARAPKPARKQPKSRNPFAENRLAEVREFVDLWMQYFQMVKSSFRDRDQRITGEVEERFLKVKSQCARKHQYLLDSLMRDYIGAERITPILSATVTLAGVRSFHEDFYRKIEKQWHTVTLHLHETIGLLRHKIENS